MPTIRQLGWLSFVNEYIGDDVLIENSDGRHPYAPMPRKNSDLVLPFTDSCGILRAFHNWQLPHGHSKHPVFRCEQSQTI